MKRYRDLAILLLAAFVILSSVLFRTALSTADDMREAQAMQARIDNFNREAAIVNQEPYRPVQKEQAGYVLQDIMALVQSHELQILNLKMVSTDETGIVYQLDLSGSWVDTAGFLENFQANDALLGFRYLSFDLVDGGVQMVIQYKIYTK